MRWPIVSKVFAKASSYTLHCSHSVLAIIMERNLINFKCDMCGVQFPRNWGVSVFMFVLVLGESLITLYHLTHVVSALRIVNHNTVEKLYDK